MFTTTQKTSDDWLDSHDQRETERRVEAWQCENQKAIEARVSELLLEHHNSIAELEAQVASAGQAVDRYFSDIGVRETSFAGSWRGSVRQSFTDYFTRMAVLERLSQGGIA